MIDHRALLVKYIYLVGEEEGISFVGDAAYLSEDWPRFTDEEQTELLLLDAEAKVMRALDTRDRLIGESKR